MLTYSAIHVHLTFLYFITQRLVNMRMTCVACVAIYLHVKNPATVYFAAVYRVLSERALVFREKLSPADDHRSV